MQPHPRMAGHGGAQEALGWGAVGRWEGGKGGQGVGPAPALTGPPPEGGHLRRRQVLPTLEEPRFRPARDLEVEAGVEGVVEMEEGEVARHGPGRVVAPEDLHVVEPENGRAGEGLGAHDHPEPSQLDRDVAERKAGTAGTKPEL